MLSTLSPIGSKTVCSNPELLHKEKAHLGNALTQCKYPKWALDKVEKRLNKPSREVPDGANNQGALQVTNLLPMKLKPRATLLYLTHKVSVKVSRRYVGGMAYRSYFKGSNTIRNLLVSPKGQRPYGQPKWGHILVPMW